MTLRDGLRPACRLALTAAGPSADAPVKRAAPGAAGVSAVPPRRRTACDSFAVTPSPPCDSAVTLGLANHGGKRRNVARRDPAQDGGLREAARSGRVDAPPRIDGPGRIRTCARRIMRRPKTRPVRSSAVPYGRPSRYEPGESDELRARREYDRRILGRRFRAPNRRRQGHYGRCRPHAGHRP
jgi:hypothetical protein